MVMDSRAGCPILGLGLLLQNAFFGANGALLLGFGINCIIVPGDASALESHCVSCSNHGNTLRMTRRDRCRQRLRWSVSGHNHEMGVIRQVETKAPLLLVTHELRRWLRGATLDLPSVWTPWCWNCSANVSLPVYR